MIKARHKGLRLKIKVFIIRGGSSRFSKLVRSIILIRTVSFFNLIHVLRSMSFLVVFSNNFIFDFIQAVKVFGPISVWEVKPEHCQILILLEMLKSILEEELILSLLVELVFIVLILYINCFFKTVAENHPKVPFIITHTVLTKCEIALVRLFRVLIFFLLLN